MLPLEELKKKYIPVEVFSEKYNIPLPKVMDIIYQHNIRVAEFKSEGSRRRSLHVNPEDILYYLERRKQDGSSN